MSLFPQDPRPTAQLISDQSILNRGRQTKMGANTEETAEYIAKMAAELAKMADAAKLEPLAYFLKMAQMEAENILRTQSKVEPRQP